MNLSKDVFIEILEHAEKTNLYLVAIIDCNTLKGP